LLAQDCLCSLTHLSRERPDHFPSSDFLAAFHALDRLDLALSAGAYIFNVEHLQGYISGYLSCF
jgi:hypothetical protein